MAETENLLPTLTQHLEREEFDRALAVLEPLHPADIAQLVEQLAPEGASILLGRLDLETASEVVSELDESIRGEYLGLIEERRLAEIIAEMPYDEAADAVADLEPKMAQGIMAALPAEDSREIRELLTHEEDTAGGIMTPTFAAARLDVTAAEALAHLRQNYRDVEELYDVVFEDAAGRLAGTCSLRDLVMADPETPVRKLVERHLSWVRGPEDQEDVAHKMRRYDLVSIPVVDEQRRVVGMISIDDVVEVLEEEATEDMYKMVGLSVDESVFSDFWFSLRRRLTWLVINLFTAFLASFVAGAFEDTMRLFPLLAVLKSIVAGSGGNAASQAVTIVVRGLALGEVTFANWWRAARKEIGLGLINGVAIGLLTAVGVYLWQHDQTVALILAVAMALNMVVAGLVGSVVPVVLKLFRIDPATSATVIVTTFTDCAGFFIFLGLGTLILRH